MPGLRTMKARLRLKLLDRIRYSVMANRLAGMVLVGASAAGEMTGNLRRSERCLISGARRLYPVKPHGVLERRLIRSAMPRDGAPAVTRQQGEITRGIILKAPRPGERGVMLLAFENQWMTLFETGTWQRVANDFDLVLAPTWSPPYDAQMHTMARYWPRPFFTLVSNLHDLGVYSRWSNRIVPIPLLASSWVNPDLWRPAGLPKAYDIVVLANFSPYKRHFALFEAMALMTARPRVLLAGVSWEGYNSAYLHDIASLWGVERHVEIRENLSNADLRAAVESARVAVFMARREGSCVAIAECLMQNIPVAMLLNAHVGSRTFINDATGALLKEGAAGTAQSLQQLLLRAHALSPRQWMLDNGHECLHSSDLLNRTVREHALANGRPWTHDLIPHCHVRLAPTLMRPGDVNMLRPLYESFEQQYGVRLRMNVMEGLIQA